MPDNNIEWGQGAVNNSNDWGKAKANATNNFGAVYDDSPSLDTNITGSTGAVLSISYSSSAFCEDASDPTPTVTDNVGAGTFSSTAGLVFVSTSTGEVDISASTSGATYLITYTDTNSATATFSLTINDLDDASFAYSQSSYAPTDADPTPTVTLAGGTFSAGSGLVFVDSGSNTGSSTGEIDLSASTIASYTITYTTAGTCPNTSTQSVEIASALAQVNNVYSMEFDGTNYIEVDTVTINGSGSFSLWFNTSSGAAYQNILSSNGAMSMFRYLTVKSGKLVQYVLGNSPGFVELTTVAVNDGNWHHLGFTYDSTTTGGPARGTFKAYVDGSLTKTLDMNGTTENWTTSPFSTIGRYNSSVGRYFNGKIDEVAIWNTVLTEQEMQSIYNATETGKTADLDDLTTPPVKWYRMGD